VAAPTKTVPHPGRALAALIALIVIMLLAIAGGDLFSPSAWHKDFRIGLGLDLSSGTELSMKATTLNGGVPPSAEMQEAITIILSRVNASGNTGAEVQTQGSDILNVSVPGKTSQQTTDLVSETALLNFRQTLLFAPYGATSTPAASATPSATATPSVAATPSAGSTAQPTPSAAASATSTAKTSAKIIPAASSSASPSATGTASAQASTSPSPSPSASSSASPSPSASAAAAPSYFGDASLVNKQTLALFNKVTCKPGDTTQWKKQAGYNQPQDYDNANVQVVSCDSSGNKYALDVSKVPGTQISDATAELSTTSNQWEVLLDFKSAGATAYASLTAAMASKYYANASTSENDYYLDTIAVVLDGGVVTAPEVLSAIPGGQSQITGNFTQASATQLQNVLKYGSLPLNFTILSENTVSATLGRAQLDGGLIAAAIGLALVVLYSFLYYRGLGLVSVLSLLIAGTLSLLAVMLLTKYQNFHLELAGIAGLIVAIGITADSFVVFFERLRDEVREGKQLRPAVEAGWKRARRTILVSDTVSFIAALLLYYFSIGEVKGFAYTLGLTTLIDIIVVFLFTKPMVTLVARTRFFGDGRPMSGLDPARLGARNSWRSSVRRTQVKRSPGAAPRSTVPGNTGSGHTGSRNTGEA
jgi:preprotein translocase subunit SecD